MIKYGQLYEGISTTHQSKCQLHHTMLSATVILGCVVILAVIIALIIARLVADVVAPLLLTEVCLDCDHVSQGESPMATRPSNWAQH